jgi:hypothetical protein
MDTFEWINDYGDRSARLGALPIDRRQYERALRLGYFG